MDGIEVEGDADGFEVVGLDVVGASVGFDDVGDQVGLNDGQFVNAEFLLLHVVEKKVFSGLATWLTANSAVTVLVSKSKSDTRVDSVTSITTSSNTFWICTSTVMSTRAGWPTREPLLST